MAQSQYVQYFIINVSNGPFVLGLPFATGCFSPLSPLQVDLRDCFDGHSHQLNYLVKQ